MCLFLAEKNAFLNKTNSVAKTEDSKPTPLESNNIYNKLIQEQIGCSGDPAIEFKKRSETGTYNNDRDLYIGLSSAFGPLDGKNAFYNVVNQEWLTKSQIRTPFKANVSSRAILTGPQNLRNYVERLDYRPVEIDVQGEGYFLFDAGPYIIMSGSKNYREKSEFSTQSECFDDKQRNVHFSIGGADVYPELKGASTFLGDGIQFDAFSPSDCSAFSFLNYDKNFFVYCKSEKLSAEIDKGYLFGFSVIKEQNQYDSNTMVNTVVPTLISSIEVMSNPYNFRIVRSGSNKYIAISGPHLYKIELDNAGKLAIQKIGFNKPATKISQTHFLSEKLPNAYMPYAFISFFDSTPSVTYSEMLPNDVAVVNLETGALLEVDKASCIIETPKEFYNRTIDPFYGSGYKVWSFEYISSEHIKMTQTSSNGGVTTDEGNMDIYIKNNTVSCVGKIDGTQHY